MNEWEWNLLEDKRPVASVSVAGLELKPGDRVRLRPRAGGDVFDLALAGKTATIEALEQDYDGQTHVAVVIDDDPGRDLGLQRQPGHRFFFSATEIEPLPSEPSGSAGPHPPRVLVAGIGNIFFGDDAFGVEVAQRLAARHLPPGVRVTDFGIRGFDLACALLDGYDLVVMVDACPRGTPPGTLHVIEPDLTDLGDGEGQTTVEPHGLDPLNVLRLARSMGGTISPIVLVGCEPETLGGDDGAMGLSDRVAAAVEEALSLVESLVDEAVRDRQTARPSSEAGET
jgi:hydrogenase maturation protease